jgi:hypothetical protein
MMYMWPYITSCWNWYDFSEVLVFMVF